MSACGALSSVARVRPTHIEHDVLISISICSINSFAKRKGDSFSIIDFMTFYV